MNVKQACPEKKEINRLRPEDLPQAAREGEAVDEWQDFKESWGSEETTPLSEQCHFPNGKFTLIWGVNTHYKSRKEHDKRLKYLLGWRDMQKKDLWWKSKSKHDSGDASWWPPLLVDKRRS